MKITSNTSAKSLGRKDGTARGHQDLSESVEPSSTGSVANNLSAGDATVSESALAAELRSLAATGSADIDTAQVDAIRQSLRDGTFQIDSTKIADGIIEEARTLASTRQRAAAH